MTSYYNEHDPFAAAWLRELIADGLIPPGRVDERDIQDVQRRKLERGVSSGDANLNEIVLRVSPWATPSATDHKGAPSLPYSERGGRTKGPRLDAQVQHMVQHMLAPWATPTVGDALGSGSRNTPSSKAHAGYSLTDQVLGDAGKGRAPWPTPSAEEMTTADPERLLARRAECKERHGNNGFGLTLGNAVVLSGLTPSGSTAPTATSVRFQLSPRFSLWLQLGPHAIAWACCGERATPSSRKSRRSSSGRT